MIFIIVFLCAVIMLLILNELLNKLSVFFRKKKFAIIFQFSALFVLPAFIITVIFVPQAFMKNSYYKSFDSVMLWEEGYIGQSGPFEINYQCETENGYLYSLQNKLSGYVDKTDKGYKKYTSLLKASGDYSTGIFFSEDWFSYTIEIYEIRKYGKTVITLNKTSDSEDFTASCENKELLLLSKNYNIDDSDKYISKYIFIDSGLKSFNLTVNGQNLKCMINNKKLEINKM